MSRRTRRSALFPSLLPGGLALLAPTGAAQSWHSSQADRIERPAEATPTERPTGSGLRATLARLDEVDATGWEALSDLLPDVHARTGVPAIAAAFVRDGEVVASATVGVVAFGSTETVGADARFHLGSVTKSFTACVVGKLVEEGTLAWDTRVGDVLPDVEMREAYRAVTLDQLLRHRSGLPAYTEGRPAGHPERVYAGSPTERRAAFLRDVLAQEPVGAPGRTVLYSNAGYALAGYLSERASGESWEGLVQRVVFEPLGMAHSGFGFPDVPLGHAGDGPEFQPVPLAAYPEMDVIAPAGNVCASVADLARYAAAQLAGLAGRDGFLRAETVQRLHATPEGSQGYACGWIVGKAPSGEPVHHHGGTVGASYAEVRLHPARRCATVVLTTVGPGVGEAVANRVARALLARYAPASSDSVAPGFVTAPGAAGSEVRVVGDGATPEEDARMWSVVRALSTAINDEDRAAYRSLFAPAYDRRDADSMFDFMARNVLPTRGGVHAFHAPARVRVGGNAETVWTVTFHLDNGFPGYFGLRLDEAGRIAELSLFVKDDLCRSGTDRHCARIVTTLAELR